MKLKTITNTTTLIKYDKMYRDKEAFIDVTIDRKGIIRDNFIMLDIILFDMNTILL